MKKILSSILFTFISVSYATSEIHWLAEKIPQSIKIQMQKQMIWHKQCPLSLNQMRYLTVSYWGFDHQPHQGHLIVNHLLSTEVLRIFQELYNIHFPIEKIVLPEFFASPNDNANDIDRKSAKNNNTYGFFCREDGQTAGQFSPHSYGIAIDINPVFNPAKVTNQKIFPENGVKYLNRTVHHEGMINEKIVSIFAKYGWKWGGYWPESKIDYQHFQKDIDQHYMSPTLIQIKTNTHQ